MCFIPVSLRSQVFNLHGVHYGCRSGMRFYCTMRYTSACTILSFDRPWLALGRWITNHEHRFITLQIRVGSWDKRSQPRNMWLPGWQKYYDAPKKFWVSSWWRWSTDPDFVAFISTFLVTEVRLDHQWLTIRIWTSGLWVSPIHNTIDQKYII